MKVEMEIETDDVKRRTVDSRGRVYLGADYAEKDVEVVVVSQGEEARGKHTAD